ncbi:metal ABC transporter permease [bacterium]|nr:metal ABC transporter permease [bacterium]
MMSRRFPLFALLAFLAAEAVLIQQSGVSGVKAALEHAARLLGVPYNTLVVLSGTTLLGLASGVIGSFAVLRRRALVGDAVAHAALPGLCVAFLLAGTKSFAVLLTGAAVAGLLGSFAIGAIQRYSRIKADAAIGIVLTVFYGAGIALSRRIQDDPTGRQAGLDSFLLGKTAGMVSQDILLIGLVAANVLLVTALLYKEFKLVIFDSAFARVQAWPALAIEYVLFGLLVVTAVIGLPAVGIVLMAALLIIPAVAARFWTDHLGTMLALAGFFGAVTGGAGTLASASWPELPAGPIIVIAGAIVFAVSALVAPRRGVVARLATHFRFRVRVARQNLLRTLYELSESSIDAPPRVGFEMLAAARSWSAPALRAWLAMARRRGEIEGDTHAGWRLTPAGMARAADIVRRHRLWELFLVRQADIAPDHVDRGADEIEHVVTSSMMALLERELHEVGRWPEPAVPVSVHPIPEARA